jgi:hypothetical protein
MSDHAKEPKNDNYPISPQKPHLPDGAKYDETEGGVPEKQPNQKPKEK